MDGSDRLAEGFHDGELAMQERAGVRAEAARYVGMLGTPELGGRLGRFLSERTFAVFAASDGAGRLWVSPLVGPAGFIEVTDSQQIQVHDMPGAGDPLHLPLQGRMIGILAIEPARRKRVRVNGTISTSRRSGFVVEVDQAYGNCPKYIQQRVLGPVVPPPEPTRAVRRGVELSPEDIAHVRLSDTFFLGTTHPERGVDASHRGGPAGFVRVLDERTLWWPDYAGNNMFNSLGNIAVDPTAALLFVDFRDGEVLHLSGTAQVEWSPTVDRDDGGTGRGVRFVIEALSAGQPVPLRAEDVVASPHNPLIRDIP